MDCVGAEVAAPLRAVHGRELDTRGGRVECEVFDQDLARQLILVDDITVDAVVVAEIAVVFEPGNVEVAPTATQVLEKLLDGMNCMQQLKSA